MWHWVIGIIGFLWGIIKVGLQVYIFILVAVGTIFGAEWLYLRFIKFDPQGCPVCNHKTLETYSARPNIDDILRARAEALDSGKYVCGNCIEPQPSFYGCSHCGTRLKGPPSFGAYEDASDSDYAKHFADGPEKDWKPQFDEEWKRKYEEFARKRQERAATQSDAPDT